MNLARDLSTKLQIQSTRLALISPKGLSPCFQSIFGLLSCAMRIEIIMDLLSTLRMYAEEEMMDLDKLCMLLVNLVEKSKNMKSPFWNSGVMNAVPH